MTTEEIITGSAFQIGGGGENGNPVWGAWGSVSIGGFEAEVDGVSLQGDVTTGILGADVSRDRWLAGLALSSSKGDGPFELTGEAASNRKEGEIESTLTAVYPYARFNLSDRVDAWGLAGLGTGTMTIREDGGTPLETDIGMTMGAVGTRGKLLEAGAEGGLDLTVKSDAMWVRMKSDEVDGLASAKADVTRVRLVLEASRALAMESGQTFTPAVEVGVRHDGGDAETGAGLEIGARAQLAGEGFSIEGAVRGLVAHEESGYEEWGASGTVRIDPGASGRGLSLTLTPTWGVPASGVEQLFGLEHTRGLAEEREFEAEGRLEAELGYGIGVRHTRGVVTPYTGLSLTQGAGRTVRAGTRWTVAPGAVLGLEGSHQGGANGTEGTKRIQFRTEINW